MGDTPPEGGTPTRDPIDRRRTTRPLAGESMKNTAKAPGFILLAAGVVAFVVCVADFALGQVGVGVAALVVALLAAGGGLAWLGMEGRRIRQVERASQRNNRAAE
jgi:hypothetical protein